MRPKIRASLRWIHPFILHCWRPPRWGQRSLSLSVVAHRARAEVQDLAEEPEWSTTTNLCQNVRRPRVSLIMA
jgi:hypothetical protein